MTSAYTSYRISTYCTNADACHHKTAREHTLQDTINEARVAHVHKAAQPNQSARNERLRGKNWKGMSTFLAIVVTNRRRGRSALAED